MKTISGRDWANFAADDFAVWEQIIGANVLHPEFGEGEITEIYKPKTAVPLICVSFASQNEKISATHFRGGRLNLIVNNLLDRRVSEWSACRSKEDTEMELTRAKFQEDSRLLTEKYGVPNNVLSDYDDMHILVGILGKLESEENLESSELIWLESQKLHEVVAHHAIRLFEKTGDHGYLAHACRHFRMAKLPDQVVSRTAGLSCVAITSPKILAALLTTRAAAFRDKGELNLAKELALEASQVFETFHPYNLLGAISYKQGARSEGDNYYEKAKRLGSPPKNLIDEFTSFD